MTQEPAEMSVVWRVATSPIGDLLRGRITGPRPPRVRAPRGLRGWRAVVDSCELEPQLREAVTRVVSRLRLWRSEREDVARELVAHFADAAASGKSPRAAVEEFGDPAQAAALITRAKKRTRPLWWHALRRTRQGLAALLLLALLVYGYLAAQFWLRSPTIARNYAAEFNAAALAAPEADRAWPLYLHAILEEENLPETLWNGWGEYRPGDPEWPEVIAYLDRNQRTLELLHLAADRSTLGMPLSDRLPRALQEKVWSRHPQSELPPEVAASENPVILNVVLAHIGEMRRLARLLRMDAAAAADQKDGARFLRDLKALAGMERHLKDGPFFITQLVAMALGRVGCAAVNEVLHDSPESLTDEELVQAAHIVAGIGDVKLRFDSERMFLDDLLQRVYSDEGDGDGRVTAEGMRTLWASLIQRAGEDPGAIETTLGPIQAAVIGSRKEMTREYDRLVARLRQSRERPMWEWTQRVSDAEMESLDKRRFAPVAAVLPSVETLLENIQAQLQHRDATLVAIALELHRRRHGHWPASLAELTPDLLPAIPPDGMDGRPLRYALRDGSPVVYSVGLDRDDDGGQVPAGGPMIGFTWQPAAAMPELLAADGGRAKYDGDLVLFPPGPRPEIVRSAPE